MILTFLRSLCVWGLLLLLVACSSHIQPTAELGEVSLDGFMSAMRWKRYKVAASLMQPAHRRDFIKTFAAVKDIHIIDVRLIDMLPSEGNRRFETTLEIDYYLPSSMVVKTFQFDQTWGFFDEENQAQQGFLITTPFPDFP